MTEPVFQPSDWDAIRLIAFDVDGTLYRQRTLRLQMARDLLLYTASHFDSRPLRVLRAYRRIREELGDAETPDFDRVLVEMTAESVRLSPFAVRKIVAEWIDRRPLPYLRSSRYEGLEALFAGARRQGKKIGVLSDYPAVAKLAALDLRADYVVSAGDADVGCLKPNPRGLQKLLAQAEVSPAQAILIGDRVDRDGAVARRAGIRVLIRASAQINGWQTFSRFDDSVFAPVIDADAVALRVA